MFVWWVLSLLPKGSTQLEAKISCARAIFFGLFELSSASPIVLNRAPATAITKQRALSSFLNRVRLRCPRHISTRARVLSTLSTQRSSQSQTLRLTDGSVYSGIPDDFKYRPLAVQACLGKKCRESLEGISRRRLKFVSVLVGVEKWTLFEEEM